MVPGGSGGTGLDPAELFGGHRAGREEPLGADAGEACKCVPSSAEGSFRRWSVIIEGLERRSQGHKTAGYRKFEKLLKQGHQIASDEKDP